LRADIGDTVEKASIFFEEGNPAEAIERVVTSQGVDLVITGIARERLFARRPVIIGKTVEQLLRRLRVPLLTDLENFLGSIFLPEDERKRLVSMVEPGAPQHLVRDYVQTHGADLVVLGTHGRGALLETLLGSTAEAILSSLPCDALVVPGPVR
jgi:nucleotide-binding universal stress UspA family protein